MLESVLQPKSHSYTVCLRTQELADSGPESFFPIMMSSSALVENVMFWVSLVANAAPAHFDALRQGVRWK
ncbi:hypothetical protein U1Q18_010262, partial [Sarracenia purpurea var. burkii]